MKNATFAVLAIVIAAFSFRAQAQTSVSTAFKNSYLQEANKEYAKAVLTLQSVYSESSYNINLRLGWLYYLAADYTKSQTYYKNAMRLQPNSLEARFGFIYPAAAVENWDSVLSMYKEILAIDANNTVANYRIGYMYYLRKDYTAAEKHLKTVLKSYPFDFDANSLLGGVYVKMGKIKEAKEYYTNALEFNPSSEDIVKILKTL